MFYSFKTQALKKTSETQDKKAKDPIVKLNKAVKVFALVLFLLLCYSLYYLDHNSRPDRVGQEKEVSRRLCRHYSETYFSLSP